ncbi:MAG: DUF4440 domain-containing protein [Ferruginibacter sp.]
MINSLPFSIVGLAFILTACSQKQEAGKPVQLKQPVISAADHKAIINREISTWQFAKIKNLQGLRLILADDYLAYFGKTTMNAADVIKTFQTSTVYNYRMSNIRVKPVSNDVAIVYYDLEQDITDINGAPWAPRVASSATYAKRNGEWKAVFYQETPVAGL